MKPYHAQIPLVLLTGFLGSGKTTLLRELLLHPQMSDTAVLINELGAVGLDHHLVWGASEALLVLENGCICCSVRDDFISALQDLFWKRGAPLPALPTGRRGPWRRQTRLCTPCADQRECTADQRECRARRFR
jgi:hypothetical protein